MDRLGRRPARGGFSAVARGIGCWHVRVIAAGLCVSLVASVLAITRFQAEEGPHAARPVDVLESEAPDSEAPNEVRAASASGSGVSWSASRGSEPPQMELDTQTLAARAEAEVPELGDAHTRVFRNDDGTLTVQASLAPINYETADGWMRISNAVTPDSRRPGWVSTAGNAWSAAFGPADEGVRLKAPEGTIRMAPVRSSSSDPEIVSSPDNLEPKTAQEALAQPAVPEPGVVHYERVWPGVDLRYEVRTGGLKEDIRILSSEARSAFAFDVAGAGFAHADDGGLRIAGDLGERFRVPPPTVAGADGSDLTDPSGVRYVLDPDGSGERTRITVALDRTWLRSQPADIFPLAVDPSFSSGVGQGGAVTVDSAGGRSTSTTISVGAQSGVVSRAAIHFPQYEQWLNEGYRAYFSTLEFFQQDASSAASTLTVYDQGQVDPSTVRFGAIGTDVSVSGSVDVPTNIADVDVARTVDRWYAQGLTDQWFGIRGTESGDTLHSFDVFMTMNVYQPPEPSRVTNLTSDQVLATTTPTLEAEEIAPSAEISTTAGGNEPVYVYQITTAPAPGTGTLVSSGELHQDVSAGDPPPSWPVPPGTLQEGITYYAWVLTDWYTNVHDNVPPTVPPSGWGVPFTVDLGLGEGGPSPTDEVGAVPGETSTPSEGAPNPALPPSKVTVNLVDGNASIAVDTPEVNTVSGGAGLRFTYNSLAATEIGLSGLRGRYYNDADDDGVITPGTDPLVAERTDPTVSFDLAPTEASVAGQDPARALARWEGFLSLQPADHTWKLGAIAADGVTITSGSDVLLDDAGPHDPGDPPTFGDTFPSTTGMPIRIDWHHSSSRPSVARVFAQDQSVTDANGEHPIYPLDPSWLTRSPEVLPAGWTFDAAATSGRWVSLADHGSSVTLYSGDGSGHEFTAAGDGTYIPPPEAPGDLLSASPDGGFTLRSAGLTYTFGPTGALTSLVTAADDREPAALEYAYGGRAEPSADHHRPRALRRRLPVPGFQPGGPPLRRRHRGAFGL